MADPGSRPLTDDEMRRQAEITAKVFKANGIGLGGAAGGGVNSFISGFGGVTASLDSAAKPLEIGLRTAGAGAAEAALVFNGLKTAIHDNLGTWRELSKAGMNFDNDIVSMATAAAASRLSLQEYASLIKENGASLAFLGGSVADGTKAFARLSARMFDFDSATGLATQKLQEMGFRNDDLNEILAVSLAINRSSLGEGQAADDAAISSAQRLALEMDKVAKLTGLSREKQVEELKKAELDSQIQARFKLIELTEGKDAADAAREQYKKNILIAESQGPAVLTAYKDMVANNGAVTLKESAQAITLLNQQGEGVQNLATATLKGNAELGAQAQRQMIEGARQNDSNIEILQARTLGSIAKVNDTFAPTFQATKTIVDSMNSIAQEAKFKGKSEDEIYAEAVRRASVREPTAGSGSTAAIIAVQNKYNDILATAMRGVATPLNEKIAPTLSAMADKYLGRRTPAADAKRDTESTVRGTQGKGTNEPVPGESTADAVKRQIQGMRYTSATGDILGEIGNKIGQIANMTVGTVTSLTIDGKGIKGEAEGSKDVWGSWFGGPSGLANIRENGPEAVVPFAKINEFVNDMRGKIPSAGPDLSGVSSQLSQLLPQAQAAIPNVSNVFSGNQGATLSDVVESLDKLNKSNGMMISYLETISNYSGKQVKATRGMSNNRFD